MRKHNKKTISNKIIFALLTINVLLFGIFGLTTFTSKTPQSNASKSPEEIAKTIIQTCSDAPYKPTCYEKEVPVLMDEGMSMTDAFNIIQILQKKDTTYGYCHVLGHKISEKEVVKDPQNWIDTIPRCPSNGMCSNGCLHGAMQGRFKSEHLNDSQIEKVVPELKIACEKRKNWNPTGLDEGICYHGLGHLTMYITKADINKSLAICDKIGIKPDGSDIRNVCYEGIFMQLFQPLETEDFDLVKGIAPTKEGLRAFCTNFATESIQEACWREGWPLFAHEIKTAQGIEDFCEQTTSETRKNVCYSMLFHVLAQSTNFELSQIEVVCSKMSQNKKADCYSNNALAIIQADKSFIAKAVSLCGRAQDAQIANECYTNLSQLASYNFLKNSKERNEFCSLLPKDLHSSCLQ